MEKLNKKSLFLISVTGDKKSCNRYFSDVLLDLMRTNRVFTEDYNIKRHDGMYCENLYDNLNQAIRGNTFEGYIIILDSLETKQGIFNPNVMFEFGAIYGMGKPFAVMATEINDMDDWPFDVKPINITCIPRVITDYVLECFQKEQEPHAQRWLSEQSDSAKAVINDFFIKLKNNYDRSRDIKKQNQQYIDKVVGSIESLEATQGELVAQIQALAKSFRSVADFIDGESNAFDALTVAVGTAKHSLRTSRFANQSIVQKPTKEQKAFMETLYEKSRELDTQFTRIICNNHPTKWIDIFHILYYGGNGSRVYVRKNDFSIHFELVIIDNRVTFIHFYQQDNSATKNLDRVGIERINSTLRIEGRDTCISFSKIFDRLHHRDFDAEHPRDPSRTLLGIRMDAPLSEELSGVGYFEIPKDASIMEWNKGSVIINQFKCAFEKWDIAESDKVNMAAGIALVERGTQFLEEMLDKGLLSKEEFDEARKLYQDNQSAKAIC